MLTEKLIKSLFGIGVLFFVSVSVVSAAATQYTYDGNGNLISDGTKCLVYNDANRLKQVKNCGSGQVLEEYSYTPDGLRKTKKEYTNGVLASTTFYISKEFETKVLANGTREDTRYVFANGEVAARINPDGTKIFYHQDHLQSTAILTNEQGVKVEETEYKPYGEALAGGTKSKYLYTGKEKDSTDLYYYGARYYDPKIGRFAQADTMLPNVYDPQQLNRYAYVRNNPVKYVDPSGHVPVQLVPLIAGGVSLAGLEVAGAGMGAWDYYNSTDKFTASGFAEHSLNGAYEAVTSPQGEIALVISMIGMQNVADYSPTAISKKDNLILKAGEGRAIHTLGEMDTNDLGFISNKVVFKDSLKRPDAIDVKGKTIYDFKPKITDKALKQMKEYIELAEKKFGGKGKWSGQIINYDSSKKK